MIIFNSLPVDGPLRITSKFGPRDTGIKGASTFHKGIDLGRDLSKPQTGILAVCAGRVKTNEWNDFRGNYVVIDHGAGEETLYQHLSERCRFLIGTKISAGQQIGIMGNSSNPAKLKVAIHLHFELRTNGSPIDPEPYLKDIRKEVEDLTEAQVRKIVAEEIAKALADNRTAPSTWAAARWAEAIKEGIVTGEGPHAYTTKEEVASMIQLAKK